MNADHDAGWSLSGEFEDVFLCRIEHGHTILVDPYPGVDPDFVRTVVSGELMAALLRQRGYLVLHGSCVTKGDNTVALIGYSGWGKSTTAAYFVNNGYRLLSEDLLVINVADLNFSVVPGPQAIKLKPDAAKMFWKDYKQFPKVYDATDKVIRLENTSSSNGITSKALQKIYLLEEKSRRKNKISDLSFNAAMVELVKHTRTIEWLNAKSFMKSHFNQCTTLLENVPISLLQRRRTLKSLPEIKWLIENDLKYS